jgi:flagellar biosynthesis protein FlhF
MGPQKFIAANTTEALKLVRQQVGGDAMVLSTRDTPQGVEIVAISPEALSSLSQRKEIEGTEFSAPTITTTTISTSTNTVFSPEAGNAADNPTGPQVEKLLAEFSAVKQLLQTHSCSLLMSSLKQTYINRNE